MTNDVKSVTGGTFGNAADEFKVALPQIMTGFDTCEATTPALQYIDVNDALLMNCSTVVGGIVVVFNLRILGVDGKIVPFKFTAQTNGGRGNLLTRAQLIEGWLLSCSASVVGGTNPNTPVYVSAGLARAPFTFNDVYANLIAGYCNDFASISYPECVPQRPTDGDGAIRSVSVANPAAGAEWFYVVPSVARQRIISLSAQLVTSAAAGNRFPALNIDDGVNTLANIPTNVTQLASTTTTYTFMDGAPILGTPAGSSLAPLPGNLRLAQNFRLHSQTAGLLAGDQWQNIWLLIQDYLDQF